MPYERVSTPIRLRSGQRIGFVEDTGMLITECGIPIQNPVDGTVAFYNLEHQAFVDGANRTLQIFLDSRLDRHYLYAGGRYLTAITMDREVVLIGMQVGTAPNLIFAFRNRIERNWTFYLNPANWGLPQEYRFYDMNGRLIPTNSLVSVNQFQLFRAFQNMMFQGMRLFGLFNDRTFTVPVVEILRQTTLRDLYNEMEHATYHPWQQMMCPYRPWLPIITHDGEYIFLHPTKQQLTDRFGAAIFNTVNGMPLILHNNTISNLGWWVGSVFPEPVLFRNYDYYSVLLYSKTINTLLLSGTPFYMGIIETHLGSFDVPMLRRSDDPERPNFELMCGTPAQGITIDHSPSEVLDGESFEAWLRRMVESGTFTEIARLATAIIAIILFVLFLPMIISLVKGFTFAVSGVMPEKKSRRKD